MMMPLVLCALLVTTGANLLALAALRRWPRLTWRREVQFAVLATPVLSLAFGLLQVSAECTLLTCGPRSPFQLDALVLTAIGRLLIAAMALLAAGALSLGMVRALLLLWVVRRDATPADAGVQRRAKRLAGALGVAEPRVWVRASSEPLALTFGFRRPTLLLSTWMVERLDRQELEAVLAHELAHAARHDYLVLWLATVLRDAFWYLPTSRLAHALLHAEKEIACDDLALAATHRPLGLASALAKVWRHAVTPTTSPEPAVTMVPDVLASAQGFVTAGELMQGRIARLLQPNAIVGNGMDTGAGAGAGAGQHGAASLPVMSARVGGLLMGTSALLLLALVVMGCSSLLVG